MIVRDLTSKAPVTLPLDASIERGLARRVPFDGRIDSVMSPGVVVLDADADVAWVTSRGGR
jgi:hypothetical protein